MRHLPATDRNRQPEQDTDRAARPTNRAFRPAQRSRSIEFSGALTASLGSCLGRLLLLLTIPLRRVLATVVTSLIALSVASLQPALAEDEATATASGLVMIGNSSSGIPDLTIRLYQATEDADHPWELKATTYTVGGRMKPLGPVCHLGDCYPGDWSVEIPPGLYRMTVNELDDDTGSWHIWSSYDSASDDNNVLVKPDVNYAFFPWGHLSAKGGGVSVHTVDQCNQDISDAWLDTYDASGLHPERLVRTDTNLGGNGFARTPLMPARIKVTDSADPTTYRWVGNAATFDAARTFDIGAGQFITESQPVVLHRTVFPQPAEQPRIAGRVSVPGGTGAPGFTVRLYRKTYDDSDPWKLQATTVTDSSGWYAATVPVGEYRVSANEPDDTGTHVSAWRTAYFGGASFDDATTKCATSRYDSGTNLSLDFAGRAISGRVTDARGKAIVGATVETYAASAPIEGSPQPEWTTKTDANGEYTTHGTGNPVKLRFEMSGTHLPEWFNDASTFDAAAEFASDEGPDSTGNDVVLTDAQLSSISPPRISGVPKYGTSVKVAPGRVGPGYPVIRTYRWMRKSGTKLTPIWGAVSTRYTVRSADVGKRLVLRETVKPNGYYPGVATLTKDSAQSLVVKRLSKVSISATRSSGRMKFTVRVTIKGVAHPHGSVLIRAQAYDSSGHYVGGGKAKTVTFRDGKATWSFAGHKGWWGFDARYSGTSSITPSSDDGYGFFGW
jgi:hypothetical protein